MEDQLEMQSASALLETTICWVDVGSSKSKLCSTNHTCKDTIRSCIIVFPQDLMLALFILIEKHDIGLEKMRIISFVLAYSLFTMWLCRSLQQLP